MSPEVHRFLLTAGVLALVNVLVFLGITRWEKPGTRRKSVDKWAERRQVSVDPEWYPQVEKQLATFRAIDSAGALFFTGVIVQAPGSWSAVTASLAALPFVLGAVQGFAFARSPLGRGQRVARLRELTVADYLPRHVRLTMWAAAVAGAAVTAGSAVTRSEPWLLVAVPLLPAAALGIEMVGARMARMPEPARDAADLYWQDALRADLIRSAANRTAYAAAFVCLVGADVDHYSDVAVVLAFGIAIALGTLVVVDMLSGLDEPAAYMRSRLWPTLEPWDVLRPGDPLPPPGASA